MLPNIPLLELSTENRRVLWGTVHYQEHGIVIKEHGKHANSRNIGKVRKMNILT